MPLDEVVTEDWHLGVPQGVGAVMLVGLFACTAPTLRALRITPTEALRDG